MAEWPSREEQRKRLVELVVRILELPSPACSVDRAEVILDAIDREVRA